MKYGENWFISCYLNFGKAVEVVTFVRFLKGVLGQNNFIIQFLKYPVWVWL